MIVVCDLRRCISYKDEKFLGYLMKLFQLKRLGVQSVDSDEKKLMLSGYRFGTESNIRSSTWSSGSSALWLCYFLSLTNEQNYPSSFLKNRVHVPNRLRTTEVDNNKINIYQKRVAGQIITP
jgi:hypothetical protein